MNRHSAESSFLVMLRYTRRGTCHLEHVDTKSLIDANVRRAFIWALLRMAGATGRRTILLCSTESGLMTRDGSRSSTSLARERAYDSSGWSFI
jgi:predicted ATPase